MHTHCFSVSWNQQTQFLHAPQRKSMWHTTQHIKSMCLMQWHWGRPAFRNFPKAQDAFKNLLVLGILQVTELITFHCALHRCSSQDIRRWKLLFLIKEMDQINCNNNKAAQCLTACWAKNCNATHENLHKAHWHALPAQALTLMVHKNGLLVRMILPQVHLRKPCYDFSFL